MSKMMEGISIKAEFSRSGTQITAFVLRLSLLCFSAVWTQGKSVQSQSTEMNGAFPTTSARQQVHKKESVQRF